MQIWKINIEKESFEMDQQLQLSAIQIGRLDEETLGDISRMMARYSKGIILNHIVLETQRSIRVFSLCNTVAEPSVIVIFKPQCPFKYILYQGTLMTAQVEQFGNQEKMKLTLHFHDLESNYAIDDIDLQLSPRLAKLEFSLKFVDLYYSQGSNFVLATITLMDWVHNDSEDVQEYFYVVIDMDAKRVYSQGWSKRDCSVGDNLHGMFLYDPRHSFLVIISHYHTMSDVSFK